MKPTLQDYQLASSLKQMVEDHFAILKVGPELTFGFREAVFALSAIEHELLRGKDARLSNVRGALEAVMLQNPSYWQDYYHGDENRIRISRSYSYSDRCRYYWHEAEVEAELELLIENLTAHRPPLTLMSQYLPLEYEAIRAGRLGDSPSEIIRHHIRTVLLKYAIACGEKGRWATPAFPELIVLDEFQQTKALRNVETISHWSLPCNLVPVWSGPLAAK
jgi:D-tagatose-1,6-bisphosphate aldolase subunit GatZ/KbaZ